MAITNKNLLKRAMAVMPKAIELHQERVDATKDHHFEANGMNFTLKASNGCNIPPCRLAPQVIKDPTAPNGKRLIFVCVCT